MKTGISAKIKCFLKTFINRVRISDIESSTIRIAFFTMLSLFPMLVTIGAALPLFGITPDKIMPYAESILPRPLDAAIKTEILNLLTKVGGGTLTLGIIGTVWSAGEGMRVVQVGVDKAYGLGKTRHFITSSVVPVVTFIAVIFLLIIFLLAFSISEELIETVFQTLGAKNSVVESFRSLKWSVSFAALFSMFAVIYKVTPNIKHKIRDVLPGAFVATVLIVILVELFSLYFLFMPLSVPIESGDRSLTYGLLGSFFVLGLWLRLVAYVVLLGAALNASVYEFRHGIPRKKENPIDDFIAGKIDGAWKSIKKGVKAKKSGKEQTKLQRNKSNYKQARFFKRKDEHRYKQ